MLGLFEGVVTGAADGYARMAERPAATLLHLGPGLGNGLANLHNARRAATPVVNIVGDHATYHARVRRPAARPTSRPRRATCRRWIGRPERTADLCRVDRRGRRRGHRPARPGRHADPAGRRVVERRRASRSRPLPRRDPRAGRCATPSSAWPRRCASGEPAALLLGGSALRRGGARRRRPASPPAPAPGCSPRRSSPAPSAAPGIPAVEKLQYFAEMAAGAARRACATWCSSTPASPVSFFAYPGKPSDLVPEGCEVHVLAARRRRRRRRPRRARRRRRRRRRRVDRRRRGPAARRAR